MNKKRIIGKIYWYIFLNGKLMIRKSRDNDNSTHRIRFSVGNYFNSVNDAEIIRASIENLLKQYQGKMERKYYPYGSEHRYYYWHLFIKELVPHVFCEADRDRLIDINRYETGNYLNMEDAKKLELQVRELFKYNK